MGNALKIAAALILFTVCFLQKAYGQEDLEKYDVLRTEYLATAEPSKRLAIANEIIDLWKIQDCGLVCTRVKSFILFTMHRKDFENSVISDALTNLLNRQVSLNNEVEILITGLVYEKSEKIKKELIDTYLYHRTPNTRTKALFALSQFNDDGPYVSALDEYLRGLVTRMDLTRMVNSKYWYYFTNEKLVREFFIYRLHNPIVWPPMAHYVPGGDLGPGPYSSSGTIIEKIRYLYCDFCKIDFFLGNRREENAKENEEHEREKVLEWFTEEREFRFRARCLN